MDASRLGRWVNGGKRSMIFEQLQVELESFFK